MYALCHEQVQYFSPERVCMYAFVPVFAAEHSSGSLVAEQRPSANVANAIIHYTCNTCVRIRLGTVALIYGCKCFAFVLAGPKRTRSDLAVQSEAFEEKFMRNANVNERKNCFAFSLPANSNAKHFMCMYMYEYMYI